MSEFRNLAQAPVSLLCRRIEQVTTTNKTSAYAWRWSQNLTDIRDIRDIRDIWLNPQRCILEEGDRLSISLCPSQHLKPQNPD
jgi:hypothetical protein